MPSLPTASTSRSKAGSGARGLVGSQQNTRRTRENFSGCGSDVQGSRNEDRNLRGRVLRPTCFETRYNVELVHKERRLRGHRNELVIERGGERRSVATERDDADQLVCRIGDAEVVVANEGPLTPTRLVQRLEKLGYSVECCNECSFFAYAGMASDSGSTTGTCCEGRKEIRFSRADDTRMTDSCEAFARGPTWSPRVERQTLPTTVSIRDGGPPNLEALIKPQATTNWQRPLEWPQMAFVNDCSHS